MRPKMILWDWNGCLLDDVPHRFLHGPCAIFEHYGLPMPSLEDYTHHITSDWLKWYYDRGIPQSGDVKADMKALNDIMQAHMAKAEMPPLFPEADAVVHVLDRAGVIQALVSSLVIEEFDRQLDHHDMRCRFSDVSGGNRKEKAPTFLSLLSKHGVDPAEAVGITDTLSDVDELSKAGVYPILVPRGYITAEKILEHVRQAQAKGLLLGEFAVCRSDLLEVLKQLL